MKNLKDELVTISKKARPQAIKLSKGNNKPYQRIIKLLKDAAKKGKSELFIGFAKCDKDLVSHEDKHNVVISVTNFDNIVSALKGQKLKVESGWTPAGNYLNIEWN